MQRTLTDRLRIIRLFDAYGRLLTERQQLLLRLYFHEDFSLSEIAERIEVTRQAVFDALRRSTGELERLDASLQMLDASAAVLRRKRQLEERLAALEAAVVRLSARVGAPAVHEVVQEVAALRRAAQ